VSENTWEEKNHWVKRSDTFSVEIVHWTSKGYINRDGGIDHHWNVYLYVYPSNKLFNKLKDCDKAYNTGLDNYFHGGATYLDKQVNYIKVGCDYGHLGDEIYSSSGPENNGKTLNPDDGVLRDANNLYDWMKENN